MIVAIVQARMRSTRLPGKMLMPMGDKCVLHRVLERISGAKSLNAVVVATSDHADDDRLAQAGSDWGAAVFRGSESDVLGRFIGAAREFDAGQVVRINADNPLIDPHYIDELIEIGLNDGVDYASYRRSDGKPVMLTAISFFAEAVSRECLERADREIVDPFEREHVTLGIYNRPKRYAVRWLEVPEYCNDPRLRLTVDTAADFELVREIIAALGPQAASAGAEDVVRLVLEHPQWLQSMSAINAANPKSNKSP